MNPFLSSEIILWSATLGVLVPTIILFIECSAALLSGQKKTKKSIDIRPTIAVLIPAHNEALEIGATLKTLLPQLTKRDRLIVIADNCSDDTAKISRALGAIAIEREDAKCRGKGYALDYGLRFLEADPPEVVVVVDADCHVDEGTIEQIACLAKTTGSPVQATYLLAPPPNSSPKQKISAFAFTVKNLVRPLGLQQLGLPCLLTGTGMAFPWPIIHQAPLASGNIVEDMQLGLDLALAGNAPLFCPSAKVTGVLPSNQKAAKSQRTRWEHGHLRTIFAQVPRLLKASLLQRRFDLLAIALDLCVPPLSLLVLIWGVILVAALLIGLLGGTLIPAIVLAITGLLLFGSIIKAWAGFGRANLSFQTLLTIFFYVVGKISIYLSFLIKPQKIWIRTERDSK